MTITIARACAVAALVLSLGAAGCGAPDVDVAKVVKVAELTTGWFDVGIVDGQNKLVPSAVVTVTNTGTEKLSGLQIYVVFRFVGETEELGSGSFVLRGEDALAPSANSKPRSNAKQLSISCISTWECGWVGSCLPLRSRMLNVSRSCTP